MDNQERSIGFVEDQIRRAISRGAFEDLPGKGKPLKLEAQTYVDPEMRLAYRMLHSAGMAPAWLEKQKDLRLEIEQMRAGLRRALSMQAGEQLQRNKIQERFRGECERLNQAIRSVNLEAPALTLQLRPINFEREFADLLKSIEMKKDQSEDWS